MDELTRTDQVGQMISHSLEKTAVVNRYIRVVDESDLSNLKLETTDGMRFIVRIVAAN